MRVKEEFTEAQRRFGLLSFYDKFEHIVILILTVLIAIFIVFAIWNLALKIFLSIASSTFDPTDYAVFLAKRHGLSGLRLSSRRPVLSAIALLALNGAGSPAQARTRQTRGHRRQSITLGPQRQ